MVDGEVYQILREDLHDFEEFIKAIVTKLL
jgi:uncharacterized protein YutE (UPF0331/DUF86 family)